MPSYTLASDYRVRDPGSIDVDLIVEKGEQSEALRAWLRENAENWQLKPLYQPAAIAAEPID